MSNYTVAVSSNVPANVPINFVTNSGTAVSSANTINVFGAGGTSTSGSGNTVTITASVTGFPWIDQAVSLTAAANTGYFCTNALTLTLPPGAAQGNTVIIELDTSSAVIVQASPGQFIQIGSATTSSGGSATSSKTGDNLYLVFRNATSTWNSVASEGTWAIL